MFFSSDQYKAFHVTDTGFSHKGSTYKFHEITDLFFSRVLTTQRLNFVKVGEGESAFLRVTTADGKVIKLSFDESSLFIGLNFSKKKDIENLITLYTFLANGTFSFRLEPYITQIEKFRYFTHDECQFFPRDRIVFRGKSFPITSSQFLKGYGYIELRPKEDGIGNKIMREITLTKTRQFNTQTNTDVVFYLLENYFGLKWE